MGLEPPLAMERWGRHPFASHCASKGAQSPGDDLAIGGLRVLGAAARRLQVRCFSYCAGSKSGTHLGRVGSDCVCRLIAMPSGGTGACVRSLQGPGMGESGTACLHAGTKSLWFSLC